MKVVKKVELETAATLNCAVAPAEFVMVYVGAPVCVTAPNVNHCVTLVAFEPAKTVNV